MVAISPDGNNLYVTSRDEDKLLKVPASGLRVIGEVALGKEPMAWPIESSCGTGWTLERPTERRG